MKSSAIFLLFALCSSLFAAPADRPNVILIMVDDMGFSDLGYHGGEIDTPNIDALAHGGVRFSQFYNSARCCPTRATLMTGLHPHQTGIGHMTQPPGRLYDARPPAYQGYLNRECVTLGEVLKPAGYSPLMTGKWHLGYNDPERWPLQRGFDKFYGCISGATRFFYPVAPRDITFGNEQLVDPESTTDEAYYTTDAFTVYAIRFIDEHFEEQKTPESFPNAANPFFLYLAYTAPHWPLQAFEDDIAKYRGKYMMGWDELRQTRYKKQIELGLIDPSWELSPKTPKIPDWDSLDEKKKDEMDLKMAVYAAMLDRVDQNIGKLVGYLKEQDAFENTLIMFLSDNGACQEGGMFGRGNFYDIDARNASSACSYGEAWSNAGSTPFRLYKHFSHEGGTATPFFMHWPARIQPQADWYHEPAQLIDLMPTILDVADGTYPVQAHGNDIPPLDGISLRPAFDGKTLGREDSIFVEHEDHGFIRDGKWKLVGVGVAAKDEVKPDKWELYDMEKDRTETKNLAQTHPEIVSKLAEKWDTWSREAMVYPKRLAKSASTSNSSELEADESPLIAKKEFSVVAEIEGEKLDGVALSHGGVLFGWSLYFQNGRPSLAVRNQGRLRELIANETVSGKATVTARLTKSQMELSVDGTVVASADLPGIVDRKPGIGLAVGLDVKDAVGSYLVPNAFTGKVISHKINIAN
ncbi:MAG: arylsulfatase [Verrucomicrobiota bacterium]